MLKCVAIKSQNIVTLNQSPIGYFIMNKIVFGTFVILAIFMAQVPGNDGCKYIPRNHSGAGRRSAENNDEDWDVFVTILKEGWHVCNSDQVQGLSWQEINECKVIFSYFYFLSKLKPWLIQDHFGEYVSTHWPTIEEFKNTDANGDGSLTLKEVFDFIGAPMMVPFVQS